MKCHCVTLNVGVWCVVSAVKIKGAMPLEETSYFYSVWWVLTSFCREIREERKCTVTSCRKVLCPTLQTSWWLTHCDFLKLQMSISAIIMCEGQRNMEFVLIYHSLLQNPKHNIQREIDNISKISSIVCHTTFSQVQWLLKSWQSTIQGNFINNVILIAWGEKMNTKFLAGADYLHGKASLTAAILCDMAKGTLFFFLS